MKDGPDEELTAFGDDGEVVTTVVDIVAAAPPAAVAGFAADEAVQDVVAVVSHCVAGAFVFG